VSAGALKLEKPVRERGGPNGHGKRKAKTIIDLPRACVLRYKDGALVEEIAPGAYDWFVGLFGGPIISRTGLGDYFNFAAILFQFRTEGNIVTIH
jgi:hypothetical protein